MSDEFKVRPRMISFDSQDPTDKIRHAIVRGIVSGVHQACRENDHGAGFGIECILTAAAVISDAHGINAEHIAMLRFWADYLEKGGSPRMDVQGSA